MEELFVSAMLCGLGIEKYDIYREKLEQLFELNPEDEMLLDLYDRTYKDALLHIHSIMKELKKYYVSVEISEFGRNMYELWNRLPRTIDKMEQPFHVLSYADDCLSYGDEKQCRKLYEAMFNFYE